MHLPTSTRRKIQRRRANFSFDRAALIRFQFVERLSDLDCVLVLRPEYQVECLCAVRLVWIGAARMGTVCRTARGRPFYDPQNVTLAVRAAELSRGNRNVRTVCACTQLLAQRPRAPQTIGKLRMPHVGSMCDRRRKAPNAEHKNGRAYHHGGLIKALIGIRRMQTT